jgi:hypothetical protein
MNAGNFRSVHRQCAFAPGLGARPSSVAPQLPRDQRHARLAQCRAGRRRPSAGNLAPSRGLGRMDVEQLALVHNAGDCDSSGLALLCVEWRLPNDVESCCGSGASVDISSPLRLTPSIRGSSQPFTQEAFDEGEHLVLRDAKGGCDPDGEGRSPVGPRPQPAPRWGVDANNQHQRRRRLQGCDQGLAPCGHGHVHTRQCGRERGLVQGSRTVRSNGLDPQPSRPTHVG